MLRLLNITMIRILFILLLASLSVTAYAQKSKTKIMRWKPTDEASVASGDRKVKYILHNPTLSNTRLSEYFNLEVVDTPKNLEKILRHYPCFVVRRVADTSVYDDEHYVEKDVYGSEEYPYHNVFVFKSKGYWRYSVSPTHTFPYLDTENPIFIMRYAPYENQKSGQPLQVIMCGKDNKYVVGFQGVTYDKNGNRQPANSFAVYLIEPASRKKLKQMKSWVKKAALVVQYNKIGRAHV